MRIFYSLSHKDGILAVFSIYYFLFNNIIKVTIYIAKASGIVKSPNGNLQITIKLKYTPITSTNIKINFNTFFHLSSDFIFLNNIYIIDITVIIDIGNTYDDIAVLILIFGSSISYISNLSFSILYF